MSGIYTNGTYLENAPSWNAEDSQWKAVQIRRLLDRNRITPSTVAEIGCGAGVVLLELSKVFDQTTFKGYDISPQAIDLCKWNERAEFFCRDLLAEQSRFDLLLAVDVFEHVPDYLGFLRQCKLKADYKIYHIPLDIHVSSVLRNTFFSQRYTVGHLHYFTADSALATLKDTEHEIIDYFYTDAAFGVFKHHPSLKRAIANVPRWIFSKLSVPFTARMFGGYSLLVLTR